MSNFTNVKQSLIYHHGEIRPNLNFILLLFMLEHEISVSIHDLPIHNLIQQGAGPA